ncbi:hypothetical protein FRC01_005222 [Tulasnella sp. 417]|nr:hypothetical protein FRC01_005222 [Tulasnella sp. 417]
MVSGRVIGEGIIKLTYGKIEDEGGKDYIKMSTRIAELMALAGLGYVVDMFPAVQYLPSWLPGMKFKRDAALWKKEIDEIEDTMFGLVKENMLSHDPEVQASFIFKNMQELHTKHEDGKDVQQQRANEEILAMSGLAIYVGGVETTETTMQSFIYAMIQFPSVQKKVQAEIDRVVGSKRFPAFKDQADLPYLHAVMLETLRWNQALSFDFDPERYVKQPPELDPREYVFGYGRRICPGKDLALQNFWILAASVLWAFNLVGEGEDPRSLPDADRFSVGLISHPIPFKCQFVPRREGLKDKLAFLTA